MDPNQKLNLIQTELLSWGLVLQSFASPLFRLCDQHPTSINLELIVTKWANASSHG